MAPTFSLEWNKEIRYGLNSILSHTPGGDKILTEACISDAGNQKGDLDTCISPWQVSESSCPTEPVWRSADSNIITQVRTRFGSPFPSNILVVDVGM